MNQSPNFQDIGQGVAKHGLLSALIMLLLLSCSKLAIGLSCAECTTTTCRSAAKTMGPGLCRIQREQVKIRQQCLGPHAEAQLVPQFVGGRATGIKLFGLRPGSIFMAAGLANGDIIRRVNGIDIALHPHLAMEAMAEVEAGTSWELVVEQASGPATVKLDFE